MERAPPARVDILFSRPGLSRGEVGPQDEPTTSSGPVDEQQVVAPSARLRGLLQVFSDVLVCIEIPGQLRRKHSQHETGLPEAERSGAIRPSSFWEPNACDGVRSEFDRLRLHGRRADLAARALSVDDTQRAANGLREFGRSNICSAVDQ